MQVIAGNQRALTGLFVLALGISLTACGGDNETAQQAETAGSSNESTDSLITQTAEQWASAYATDDPGYCDYMPQQNVNLCRNHMAEEEATAYQAGYLNATVSRIDHRSTNRSIVTLSNGCKIVVTDEGNDWRVSDAGGSLAKECEQGTGR